MTFRKRRPCDGMFPLDRRTSMSAHLELATVRPFQNLQYLRTLLELTEATNGYTYVYHVSVTDTALFHADRCRTRRCRKLRDLALLAPKRVLDAQMGNRSTRLRCLHCETLVMIEQAIVKGPNCVSAFFLALLSNGSQLPCYVVMSLKPFSTLVDGPGDL